MIASSGPILVAELPKKDVKKWNILEKQKNTLKKSGIILQKHYYTEKARSYCVNVLPSSLTQ